MKQGCHAPVSIQGPKGAMKIATLLLALTFLSACGEPVLGVSVGVPVGNNGMVGVETNTKGETKVTGSITVGK